MNLALSRPHVALGNQAWHSLAPLDSLGALRVETVRLVSIAKLSICETGMDWHGRGVAQAQDPAPAVISKVLI